jgi:Vacuolar protein sorting-associated protein 26
MHILIWSLMDFQSFFGGLVSGGLKVDIVLEDPGDNDKIVTMHHPPSWKLRKNPFWRVGSVAPSNGELVYEALQEIKGKVRLTLPHGKKADHLGIKLQFVGRIDMVREKQNLSARSNSEN